MAVRVVNLQTEDLAKILAKGISKPIRNAKPYFNALATKMWQQSMLVFKKSGSRASHTKWSKFSQKTLHPYQDGKLNTKKWNLRKGTDDSKTRKYNSQSKLLQASGSFRNSFTIIKTDKRRSIVGTKMKLAKSIMSNPDRPVLFVDNSDYKLYSSMFRTFIDKGIKF